VVIIVEKNSVCGITIKRNKDIKEENLYKPFLTNKICHVLDVGIYKRFKVSGFVMYTRTQCQKTHLKVYYSKITKVVHDEKTMIH